MRRGEDEAALRDVRAALAAGRVADTPRGLRFLEGRLLAELGDAVGARAAFDRALAEETLLAPWTRQELAELDLAAGEHAAAAQRLLLAFASSADRRLRDRAHAALRRSAEAGAGCRQLRAGPPAPARHRSDARRLELLVADCDLAAGDLVAAGRRWQTLLRERNDDRVAQEIVDRLGRRELAVVPRPDLPDDLLGLAAARQRDFARAVPVLERAVAVAVGARRAELALALARSRFWLGDHSAAASALETLAAQASPGPQRAEALFFAARARELAADFAAALADHRSAEAAAPHGPWADAARLAIVRLAGRAGAEREALAAVARFGGGREGASTRGRAYLLLAVDDLVAGRRDRAEAWLSRARQGNPQLDQEVAYWRGRLAELERRTEVAVASYSQALADRPHRPFASASAERLRSPALRRAAEATAARLANGGLPDRKGAATLRHALGLTDPAADARLSEALRHEPRVASFLSLEVVAPNRLPLPDPRHDEAPTRLLRLGLWRDGASAAGRRFSARPGWALGAASALVEAGEPSPALALAEGVAATAPRGLPERWWPEAVRLALVPPAYRELILPAAGRHRVDPALVAAILREESRFDTTAFSPAGARGLGQFVLPTANRLAAALGWADFTAADLERPEIAIELTAAHLAELGERYGDRTELVVAAYNAGEAQVEAWRRTCATHEPAEFLSRVAFRETRGYLSRVLESRDRYRERRDWQSSTSP